MAHKTVDVEFPNVGPVLRFSSRIKRRSLVWKRGKVQNKKKGHNKHITLGYTHTHRGFAFIPEATNHNNFVVLFQKQEEELEAKKAFITSVWHTKEIKNIYYCNVGVEGMI